MFFGLWGGLLAMAIAAPSENMYDIDVTDSWMTMKDGTKISVTYYTPKPKGLTVTENKFPVLFELLPYRKDDSFWARDYGLFSYFVRRGYIVAKADIRGTGSSFGKLPDREYSDIEISDAKEMIRQLARLPNSNGRVGMFGISWGGFNAIMTAMEQPKELKAILAVDASDDLFYDDVRFIDGALHFDEYELNIDHENGLPRSPDYAIDNDYLKNRFDQTPWIFNYKKNNFDSEFWRKKSLRFNYDKFKTPAYVIGGLLDGYRDSVPNMLQNVKTPIIAEMGPWNHAWPDDGDPAPRYEWRDKAVRWWDHWLKGIDTGILKEPKFLLFVRAGHSPGDDAKESPGHFRYEEWPIKRTEWLKLYPSTNQALTEKPTVSQWLKVNSKPSAGIPAYFWFGETTGDFSEDDQSTTLFDSGVLSEKIEMIGFPKIKLATKNGAPFVNWVVRLEDIDPSGKVAFVTGGLFNANHQHGRHRPAKLKPNERVNLDFELRFTTWTFQPGHRIRVSIANSIFPMILPSPFLGDHFLKIDSQKTFISLPTIPYQAPNLPALASPEPREAVKGAESFADGVVNSVSFDPLTAIVTVMTQIKNDMLAKGIRWFQTSELRYMTHDQEPMKSGILGKGLTVLTLGGREVWLASELKGSNEVEGLRLSFSREISENGNIIRRREWSELIPWIPPGTASKSLIDKTVSQRHHQPNLEP